MLLVDRRHVRVLLLRVALRAAGARLLAAGGGPRVPAVHARASSSARASSQRDRAADPPCASSRVIGIGLAILGLVILRGVPGRRHVPRQPAAGHHPDVDRHGHDVPAADARRDHRRLRRRTPASPRACSTRRSRWAARSAWRSCRRSPPRTRRACSRSSAERRPRSSGPRRSSRGSRSPTWAASDCSSCGAIVLVAVLRTRDMAAVAAAEGQPVAVGA